jgi:hypothetical protein
MASARRRNEVSPVGEKQAEPLPKSGPVTPQPAENKTCQNSTESWRELAERIQKETDPAVMIELTHELLDKFDAEKSQKQCK